MIAATAGPAASVVVSFGVVGAGLVIRPPGLGFEVLQGTAWVAGNVTSHTASTVTVTGALDTPVIAVRYAYEDKPCPNMGCAVYGPTGLPSTPFVRNVTASA